MVAEYYRGRCSRLVLEEKIKNGFYELPDELPHRLSKSQGPEYGETCKTYNNNI